MRSTMTFAKDSLEIVSVKCPGLRNENVAAPVVPLSACCSWLVSALRSTMCAPGTTAPDESETEIERLAVLESANAEDEGKAHNIASIAQTTDRRKGTSFLGIL